MCKKLNIWHNFRYSICHGRDKKDKARLDDKCRNDKDLSDILQPGKNKKQQI